MEQKQIMQNSATSEEMMMDDKDDIYDGMKTESRYTRYGKSRAVNCEQVHSSQMPSYGYQTQAKINFKLNCANQTSSRERK